MGKRECFHVPRGSPPSDEFFAARSGAAALGPHRAAVMLPGLSVGLEGMDTDWHAAFLARFGSYAADLSPGMPVSLSFSSSRADIEHFIPPPPAGRLEFNPLFLEAATDPSAAGHYVIRLCTYGLAGRFSSRGGRGELLFARQSYDPRERAVENLLRVAVAWLAVVKGGMLMHSASIERDGKAWLFFGASGAGKSTLSALSRRGRVISDDLTILLPWQGGPLEAVGSPFRGTYTGGDPVHGRFPVAAAFKLKQARAGEAAAVEPLPERLALPAAIANLPFVVDQLAAAPGLFASVERGLRSFPIHLLRFTRHDDSFWDAIEQAPVWATS